MIEMMLFIDGSVNTKTKTGYGAYLFVSEDGLSPESCKTKVKLKRFENTSSTRLELQILLWALNDIPKGKDVNIFTDSQNIISLLKRRDRLEQNDYYSKKKIRLKNYELYREFFKKTGEFNCTFIKVQGHKPSYKRNHTDRLFSVVDMAARNALRMSGD